MDVPKNIGHHPYYPSTHMTRRKEPVSDYLSCDDRNALRLNSDRATPNVIVAYMNLNVTI